MTRETKIGLLVGLAFIIVIGILLSDHLTSSTEPPLATLAQTGSNVRQTISTPGGSQPPITQVTPPQVQPQQQVPTQREATPPTPATEIVHVGGPQSQQPQQQPQAVQPAPVTPQQPEQQQVAGADMPNRALARIAQQNGEQLVSVGSNGQQQPLTGGMTDYAAEPGDSVSRMAGKLMGGNTKANRDAIIRANPSLQQDPNKVIVGKTYKIPTAATAMAPAQAPAPAPSNTPIVASSTEYWYTVKEGDNLTRIAREQLGQDPSGIPAILELNRDVLKGDPNKITANMKLRLPSKPLAQAN